MNPYYDEDRHTPSIGFMSPTLQSLVVSSSPNRSLPVLQLPIIGIDKGYDRNAPEFICISPMVTPIKDPFSGKLPKPAPLSLGLWDTDMIMEGNELSSYPIVVPAPGSSFPNLPIISHLIHQKNDKIAYDSMDIDTGKISPRLPMIHPQYSDMKFSITTYRWQPIDDLVCGVPVVEIRPYNKSDGKRYVYVKVDGWDETLAKCRNTNFPIPKVKFVVERCLDSTVLGCLYLKDMVEKKDDEIVENMKIIEEKIKVSETDEDKEKEVFEITRSMTLFISEKIVKQLDKDGIGKGSPPPEEHKLRVVVKLVVPGKEGEEAEHEVALLPFYRIKRRQKRRGSPCSPGGSSEMSPIDDDVEMVIKKSKGDKFVESKGRTLDCDISLNRQLGTKSFFDEKFHCRIPAPLINTAPNSPHFVDLYCVNCGPERNVKLVCAEEIFCVNASNNEIWINATTKNVLKDSGIKSGNSVEFNVFCRFCRTHVGSYFHQDSKDSGSRGYVYRFLYVDPVTLNPVLFYRWIPSVLIHDMSSNGFEGEIYSPDSSHGISAQKAHQGWIGRPLLESEFPGYSGAYSSLETVKPIPFLDTSRDNHGLQ